MKLDDAAKVRLLLRKLSTLVHSKYINYILPKHPRDYQFEETVKKLTELFGLRKSQFHIRFNCFQISKDEQTDFITYAGIVNKQCENFKLADLKLDQFKCLIFVIGMKSSTDFEIRTKLLNKLDDPKNEITLDGLVTECQRLINLKSDTALIQRQSSTQVNQLQSQSNGKTAIPRTPCWFCGSMHFVENCDFKNHKCKQCQSTGHKEGYCNAARLSKRTQPKKQNRPFSNARRNKKPTGKVNGIFSVNSIHAASRKYVTVNIDDVDCELQFDTAADITVIDEETFESLQNRHKAIKVERAAKAANQMKLPLTAQFEGSFKFKGKSCNGTCFVTSINKLNVLGLDIMEKFALFDDPISTICNQVLSQNLGSVNLSTNQRSLLLKSSFADLFDGKMGLCNKTKAKLVAKPNQQPIFRPKRPVAYAMLPIVEEELRRLQENGVLSPVNYSDWAAPIVVIKKPIKIRVCADFSTGLNDALEMHQHPLPLPEDIFANIANGKYFSHLDFSDAFLQIEVDDDSKHLLTINTHLGLFRYNRMVFGVKVFPAIFQQVMDEMLAGLSGVAAYIDDIFVSGATPQAHDQTLSAVLDRIRDYGFKLKFEKCRFFVDEVEYLGFIINKHGLKPNPERVAAIIQMPQPSNVSELRSFLGAINFYSRFVENMRLHRGPLDELLKANIEWKWTKQHQQCFQQLKDILSSDLLLTHYDPQLKIIVAADASNYGLGACIQHEFPDGSIKTICHASRSLTPAEKQYSQIEKEALGIMFAVTKFHKMIYGRKFQLHTDHKPLLAIFGKKTGISAHQANRLQRWAFKLTAYEFDIKFISTNSFGYADVLSRLIDQQRVTEVLIASIDIESSVKQILADVLQQLPITHQLIKSETTRDKPLRSISEFVINGWPPSVNSEELKIFFNRKDDISIVEGCLMFGERVIISSALRQRILKQLHRGHPGIGRTKAIARSFVYWPNIDNDIESLVRNCDSCASTAKMPTKTELHP